MLFPGYCSGAEKVEDIPAKNKSEKIRRFSLPPERKLRWKKHGRRD
jgi:hypothetical protein